VPLHSTTYRHWIPAFAGMTSKIRHSLEPVHDLYVGPESRRFVSMQIGIQRMGYPMTVPDRHPGAGRWRFSTDRGLVIQ
jgi:hypothetical protein